MRHMTSQLRGAAARRRVIDADAAPADHSTQSAFTDQFMRTARVAACWAETLSVYLSRAAFESRQATPPVPHIPSQARPSARASSDFTAQVMARLASSPPEPDPRDVRARRAHAHMRRLASIYLTLVLASGVALVLLAAFAPWVLLGLVAGAVSVTLLAMAFASFIGSLTDGVISGFGVAYIAMLAALAPPLALLARRAARGRYSSRRRL